MTEGPWNLLMECWNCEHTWWATGVTEPGAEVVPCPECGEENAT